MSNIGITLRFVCIYMYTNKIITIADKNDLFNNFKCILNQEKVI